MKKLFLIPLLALLMSGCIYQVVDITDILKGQQYCADRHGLKLIEESFAGNGFIECVNGDRAYAVEVDLLPTVPKVTP